MPEKLCAHESVEDTYRIENYRPTLNGWVQCKLKIFQQIWKSERNEL